MSQRWPEECGGVASQTKKWHSPNYLALIDKCIWFEQTHKHDVGFWIGGQNKQQTFYNDNDDVIKYFSCIHFLNLLVVTKLESIQLSIGNHQSP